jgi:hypothetical protein
MFFERTSSAPFCFGRSSWFRREGSLARPLRRMAAMAGTCILLGCAQPPIYSTFPPASSRLDAAPTGKSLLTIYRPDEFFSAQRTFLVFDRTRFIGSLSVGTSLQYVTDPGEHLIIACACAGPQASTVQVPSPVVVNLRSGETYDLVAEFATGWDMGQAALGDRVKFSAATKGSTQALRQSSKLVKASGQEIDNAAARRVIERAQKMPPSEIPRLGGEGLPMEPPKVESPASTPTRGDADFEQCFDRCRKVTDRTKEQCFDVCRK